MNALPVVAMLALLAAGMPANAAAEPPARIERIDLKTDPSSTKVIIMLSRPLPFQVHVFDGEAARKSTRRLVLDFENTTLAPEAAKPIGVDSPFVHQVRTGTPSTGTARIVVDLASDAKHSVEAYETPPHVTIAIGDTSTTEGPAPERNAP